MVDDEHLVFWESRLILFLVLEELVKVCPFVDFCTIWQAELLKDLVYVLCFMIRSKISEAQYRVKNSLQVLLCVPVLILSLTIPLPFLDPRIERSLYLYQLFVENLGLLDMLKFILRILAEPCRHAVYCLTARRHAGAMNDAGR